MPRIDWNDQDKDPMMTVRQARDTHDTLENWKKDWIQGYKNDEERKKREGTVSFKVFMWWLILVLMLTPVVGSIFLKLIK